MESVMVTFDAIRGLPGDIAERVASIIWDAAQRDKALRDALEDATTDFLRWESEQSAKMSGWTPFQNERLNLHHQGQDDQLLADLPW